MNFRCESLLRNNWCDDSLSKLLELGFNIVIFLSQLSSKSEVSNLSGLADQREGQQL